MRASIADLSEENTRDLEEVQRRGLQGGINLVRGLREELRDIEYHLSETRSMKTACKAKISMILARIPNKQKHSQNVGNVKTVTAKPSESNGQADEDLPTGEIVAIGNTASVGEDTEKEDIDETVVGEQSSESEIPASVEKEIPQQNDGNPIQTTQPPPPHNTNSEANKATAVGHDSKNLNASQRIALGDSQAIAIIQPGNNGFFTVDLWEVLLRIIGFEKAANRRSVQNAGSTTTKSRQKIMII